MFTSFSVIMLRKFIFLPYKSVTKSFSFTKPWRGQAQSRTIFHLTRRRHLMKTNCDITCKMFSINNTSFPRQQYYDYFLILDFEATCDIPYTPKPQEIIEFPVLKLNAKTFHIESTYHTYVKPKINLELSTFCIELTGIIQDQVHNEPHLDEVLKKFHLWYERENLSKPDVKSIFVTCGDWDLYTMLPGQCSYFNILEPEYFKKWINLKKSYVAATSTWPKDLTFMTQGLGLNPIGRLHSGIDDCKNMVAIMKSLAERGYVFTQTGCKI